MTGGVVIRSVKDVTKPANTALSDGMEDAQQAGPPTEMLIGRKTGGPMHVLDGPENTRDNNPWKRE